jgi:hypothetical protein
VTATLGCKDMKINGNIYLARGPISAFDTTLTRQLAPFSDGKISVAFGVSGNIFALSSNGLSLFNSSGALIKATSNIKVSGAQMMHIHNDSAGNCYMTGHTNLVDQIYSSISKHTVFKFDPNLNFLWGAHNPGSPNGDPYDFIRVSPDGKTVFVNQQIKQKYTLYVPPYSMTDHVAITENVIHA